MQSIKVIEKTNMLNVKHAFEEEKPALFRLSGTEINYTFKYVGWINFMNDTILTDVKETSTSCVLKNADLYFKKSNDSKIAIWKKVAQNLNAEIIGTKLLLGNYQVQR